MPSCTSLMPTAWPAKTVLKLIFFLPRQMRPQCVTTIVLSWNGDSESFVRSFGVADIDEFVEACLLLKEICSCWFGGFLFQSEMHTFVTAVLLRMTWLNGGYASYCPAEVSEETTVGIEHARASARRD